MNALFLREPVSVPDALERDKIVRRLRKLRADAVLEKHTAEHWNRLHPDQAPIDTSWCDEIIAWCDGKGLLPAFVEAEVARQRRAAGRAK